MLDGFIRRRLRAVPRNQEKRPSRGLSAAGDRRWSNAFFANQGLFTLYIAFGLARHPR
jgi:RNA-directed DNA polymerase